MIKPVTTHLFSDKQTQLLTLAAQPEPLEIDRATTAVFVIDKQNDFGGKEGQVAVVMDAGPAVEELALDRGVGVDARLPGLAGAGRAARATGQ